MSTKTYSRTFEWLFDLPVEDIWAALADTARFNEAAGLPKHAIEETAQADGTVRFFAEAKVGPMAIAWEEIPVEWVAERHFRHLRVFSKGPLKSLAATFEMQADGAGGSVGHYTIDAKAANPLGHLILSTVFFPVAERLFTGLAETALEWAKGLRDAPFETPPSVLTAAGKARIEASLSRLEASPNAHGLGRRLADWIAAAQDMDISRIRPLALARQWQVGEREVIEMCLQSVKDGLLQLRWDLLCPRCRGAKLTATSLDQVPTGAHCDSCNVSYDRDFARNVELSFQPAPALRPVTEGEFCLFGPMTTPHIKVQINLEAGASELVEVDMAPGPYRLRTLQIGGATDVDFEGGGFPELVAADGTVAPGPPAAPGEVRLTNRENRPLVLIVESRNWVEDALTAHRVTAMQCFRDLFSAEVLRPGDAVDIAQVTLIFTDLKGSTAFYERVGDVDAYRIVREHFGFLAAAVREAGGAVVKTIGDAVMAVFIDPADAVRAAIAMQARARDFAATSGNEDVVIKLGIHTGACVAVVLNDRLDYFGSTVNMAARLEGQSGGGEIIVSAAVMDDPAASALLEPYAPRAENQDVRGFERTISFWRVAAEALAKPGPPD